MYYRRKVEYEIDLKDTVFYLLRKWRGILVTMLAVAVLMGGYTAWSQWGATVNEKSIASLKKEIAVNQEVINGNNAYIADQEARLAANADLIAAEEQKITELKSTRQLLMQQLEACKARQAGGERSEDLAELVIRLDQQIADVDARLTQCDKMILALQKEKSTIPDAIMDIRAASKKVNTTNNTLKAQIAALQAVGLNPKDVAGKTVVGAVLGLLLALVVDVVRYLADRKVRSAARWQLEWTVPVLGDLHGCPLKKSAVDRWIDRMAGEKPADEPLQLAMTAAGIRNCAQEGAVLLVGTADQAAMEQLREKMVPVMDGKGPALEVTGNPLSSPEALLQVKDRQILLVEEAEKASFRQVQNLLDTLARSGAKVLGVVIL